jgi:acyl-CoA synthetase (AMP-forming)/AMP-acid ligase II
LTEIEASANSIEGVGLSCCVYDRDTDKLTLFFCAANGMTEKEFTLLLRKKVPAYMLPDKVIALSDLPLTNNQKPDRVYLLTKAREAEK